MKRLALLIAALLIEAVFLSLLLFYSPLPRHFGAAPSRISPTACPGWSAAPWEGSNGNR